MDEPALPRSLRVLCGCLLALLLYSDADASTTGVRSDLTDDHAVTRAHAVRAMAGRPLTSDVDAFALPTPAISFSRVAAILFEPPSPNPAPEPDTERETVTYPPRAPPPV